MRQQTAFSDILNTKSGDVERPKPIPPGQYVFMVQGQPRFDKSARKQTEFVEFTLKFVEPIEDAVDGDAVEEWLTKPDGTRKNFIEQTTKVTYYLTDNALWRLNDFLDHCGAGDEDMSLGARIAETPGKQVIGTVKHQSSEDGQAIFSRVENTAPVE